VKRAPNRTEWMARNIRDTATYSSLLRELVCVMCVCVCVCRRKLGWEADGCSVVKGMTI
jgi:hypothetical protein